MHARVRNPMTTLARRFTAACAAAMLLVQIAGAQEAPGEEPPRRYTVELIVFAYDESVSSGNEVFVPEAPPAERLPEYGDRAADPAFPEDLPETYGDARAAPFPIDPPDDLREPAERADDAAGASLTDRPPARQWIELELHAEQQPRMNEIYGRLVDIDAYRPLMRAAWTQTTHARDEAPALHLQSLGSAPPGLDGTVTLYAGRFVHLVLDLALDAAPDDAPAEAVLYRGDGRRADDYAADPFGAPLRYRLEEDRIMRVDDVRYFDHPRFGVIARVTVPEDAEPPVEGELQETVTGSDQAL